jgi:hypothetical protein
MIWTVWAVLLVAHGAFSRWARTTSRYAAMSTLADALLIVIGLITIDQMQGLPAPEFLRIGIFFVAFGVTGRQLMGSMLRQPARSTRAT